MSEIYADGTYLQQNPTWHEEDSPWKAGQIVKMLERNGLRPCSVCEVGCGAGEILKQLANRYRDQEISFTGFEVSPQAFLKCKPKELPNLKFMLHDVLAGPVADATHYDIALVIDIVEHVEDYFAFLRKLKPIAKYKLFHIPLDLSLQSLLRVTPILFLRKSVGHIHSFTKEIALEALKDTGYEIVDHFYTASALELPNRGWKAALAHWPRRAAFKLNKDVAARVLGGYSLLVLAT